MHEDEEGVEPSTPLLSMRLVPPVPAPGIVSGPMAIARMLERTPQVYLIGAPAGWGKTPLLACGLRVGGREDHTDSWLGAWATTAMRFLVTAQ